MQTRGKGMYMVTIPAGTCGGSINAARKIQDRIISAITRRIRGTDYSLDLLSGVADIDLDKGEYCNVRTGRRGRPERIQTTIPGKEYIADPSPHIHIVFNCCPGATIANMVKDVCDNYLSKVGSTKKANLQEIATIWEDRKFYVIKQSKYFRVVEHGDPEVLPKGKWQFSGYGRGKRKTS